MTKTAKEITCFAKNTISLTERNTSLKQLCKVEKEIKT